MQSAIKKEMYMYILTRASWLVTKRCYLIYVLQIKRPVLLWGAGLEEVLIAVENWEKYSNNNVDTVFGRQTPYSPLSQRKLSLLTCFWEYNGFPNISFILTLTSTPTPSITTSHKNDNDHAALVVSFFCSFFYIAEGGVALIKQ